MTVIWRDAWRDVTRFLVVATLLLSCLTMVAGVVQSNVHRIAETSAWAALMLAIWVWMDEP